MSYSEESFKRKYPRKSFPKKLSFMCEGHANLGQGVEIGEGGISFISNEKIDLDQKMIVSFFLSNKDFFSVKVTLKNIMNNSSGYVYGTSFDDISIALKREIRTYVARTVLN